MADKLEVTVGWFDNRTPVYRRVVMLYISPEFLFGIIQGKYEVDPAQFPTDVRLGNAEWDHKAKSFILLLESEEYPKTAEGNTPLAVSLRLRHKENA